MRHSRHRRHHVWPWLVVALAVGCESPGATTPPVLRELIPGFSYSTWFAQFTGETADPEFFGVYGFATIGPRLYLGVGASRPAAADGAALAAIDDAGFHELGSLDEQGFLDLEVVRSTVHVPGVDPCCPDDWTFGNTYTFHPVDGLRKQRALPNVIHGWGAWFDEDGGDLHLAVSSHLGDFATWTGEVWRSTDLGETWQRVADRHDGVGDFRTYDIIGHGNRLYAVTADGFNDCHLVAALDPSTEWSQVLPPGVVACLHRLGVLHERLAVLDSNRTGVYLVDHEGAVERRALPFEVGASTFNWAAPVGDHVYAAANDGRILVTRDLSHWETVLTTDHTFLAVKYWPEKNALLLSDRGLDGSVRMLDLCGELPCPGPVPGTRIGLR